MLKSTRVISFWDSYHFRLSNKDKGFEKGEEKWYTCDFLPLNNLFLTSSKRLPQTQNNAYKCASNTLTVKHIPNSSGA